MDQIEEPTVQNPEKWVSESQLQAYSSNPASNPPPDGPDLTAEDGDLHSDQWLSQLQNLDLEKQATGIESRHSTSDGERDGVDANGKSKEESNGDERIESDKVFGSGSSDEIDGNNVMRKFAFPVRPEAVDCAFYMKTGNCKFGANCKFNHPVRTNNQVAEENESEETGQKRGQTECKYYLRTGGCKYGRDCRFIHSKPRTHVSTVSELNFLGLPIRPGERECPFYMRNGSCKFGANCKFNHPDPKAVRGADPAPVYVNGVPGGPISSSQLNAASWSVPRPLNETTPYVPVMSSTQGFPSQSPEWNGYQTPTYPQERSMHPSAASQSSEWNGYETPAYPQEISMRPLAASQSSEWNEYQTPAYPQERSVRPSAAFVTNNVATGIIINAKNQPLPSDDEFPERPGEPACSYFLKTGDCKFKSNCKYHHPKNRAQKPPPCALSDKGLPLRPDQNICSHYSRYGICKFGPACKFDHPINPPSSSLFDPDKPMASTN